MSNIKMVIEFIEASPYYVKEEMITKIMNTLNVTRSNAQVYIYNAERKRGKIASVKEEVKSSTAPIKEVKVKASRKTEYLPGQTSGEAKGKVKSVDTIKSEMAEIEANIDSFEESTKPSKAGFYRIPKTDEEIARIKEERLDMMKAITKRQKAAEAKARKEEKQAEMDQYAEEADSYVEHLKADFKRGKLSIATAD